MLEKELKGIYEDAKDAIEERLNSLVRIQSNIVEEEKNYVVKFTLAGMQKEDVIVEINNMQLIVKSNNESKNKNSPFFKEFYKQVDLSLYDFDKASISSEINNGVLAVFLQKSKKESPVIKVDVVDTTKVEVVSEQPLTNSDNTQKEVNNNSSNSEIASSVENFVGKLKQTAEKKGGWVKDLFGKKSK